MPREVNPIRNSDPLLLVGGKRVTTATAWCARRRAQIVELFDREIYGCVPSSTPDVTWTVTDTQRTVRRHRAHNPVTVKSGISTQEVNPKKETFFAGLEG